ncbi:MAG TPA: FkbM family methyltransferase [Chthoniobacterales bacterium]
MPGITDSVTTFLHNARRSADQVRRAMRDISALEGESFRLGRGRFKDGIVLVTPNEINDRHGTGVILGRCFGKMRGVLSLRSTDLYGNPDFGDASLRFAHHGRSRAESYLALCDALAGNRFNYIVCVPYFPDELLTAIILKDIFQAKLCVYVMDDNHLATDGIPYELMREALQKADLRLAISPEMRDGYEQKFGLQFWLRPPVVTAGAVSTRPVFPADSVLESRRAVVIGNLWSTQALRRLAGAVHAAGLHVDWFGNAQTAWLAYDVNELAAQGVVARGFVPEADLTAQLENYPFALVPSGTLEPDDERSDIAKYSLPTRLPFLLAAANMPTIVLGSPRTAAAAFVDRFGLGVVAGYDGPSLRAAAERLCLPAIQCEIRQRAASVAARFSSDQVGEWILQSIDRGRPVTDEIEDLFPRRPGDYSVYFDPPPPPQISSDFHQAYFAAARLRWQGFRPDFILDVGASTAVWAETMREVFPDSRIVSIEPLRDLYQERYPYLRDKYKRFEVLAVAVSDQPGEHAFQVSSDFYGSSLLQPQDQRNYQKLKVPVRTLDQLQQELNLNGHGLLKLDIQFAEHLALAGAMKLLPSIDVIMLELSLPRLAHGARTFPEMLSWLIELGYRYYDDIDDFRAAGPGTLLQKDVVFVRNRLFPYKDAID